MVVTALFGLAPALRGSAIKPLAALKGSGDLHAQRRLTHALIAAQMAFCVFLLVAAFLFVATFERLVSQPLGFAHHNRIVLQTESRASHPPDIWAQIADHLRQVPGVTSVALAGWAPLTGNRWRASVRVAGHPFQPNGPYFVGVSSAYFETMGIGMVQGRDFRAGDAPPGMTEERQTGAGVGIVNEAFARAYFEGRNPIGHRVIVRQQKDVEAPMEIVGLVRDAAYYSVREPVHPTVYVPVETRNNGALIVRTASEPSGLAAVLRHEVSRARPDFCVRAAEPLTAFVGQQMIRERLLATLSMFFAVVALVLAGIGIYGVLNYTVTRQRREIGIRMALGARAAHVVRRVTLRMLGAVCVGSCIGLAAGIAFGRVVHALLFQVQPTDPATLITPVLALAAAVVLAAVPPAIRAVRIDPAQTLRSD